jgi:hypothetical protein
VALAGFARHLFRNRDLVRSNTLICSGLKIILFVLLLFSCSCALVYGEYVLQDSEFLRLRVLLKSSLNLTDEQISILLSNNPIYQNSNQVLNNSDETIANLKVTINDLLNLKNEDKQTISKLSELLNQRLIVDVVIVLAALAAGYGLGKLF